MTDPLIHKRMLGRYRIVRSLAVGGMGVIYLARGEGAAGFSKPAVIKRIVPNLQKMDADAEQYFVNEAKLLSQMRHPGIVSVIDFGQEADGAYVMVLEYVHGFHLGDWLRYYRHKNEHFPAEEAIYVICQVLDALEYAHNLRGSDGAPLGIVHRDVTPSNVLIDVDGHVKLADFGIAAFTGDEEEEGATKGRVRGKIPYLAPELLFGKPATAPTDVYSAAVTLHTLLIGKNEFKTSKATNTIQKVVEHVPTRPSKVRDDVSHGIDHVLSRALSKDPLTRYPTAEALRADLQKLLRESAADIQRRLEQKVRADFEGDMPAALGLEPLELRDAALRDAPRTDPPTGPTLTEPTQGVVVASKRSVAIAAVAGILLLAAVTGGVLALTSERPRGPTSPRFIVVEHNERRPDPTGTLLQAPNEAAPLDPSPTSPLPRIATSPTPATDPTGTTPPRPVSREERLTRAFAAHRGAIRACFEQHTLELSGAPRIEIAYRIGRDGQVESAQLEPSGLMGTALGGCILGVARRVTFGPQDGAISFRIPLTASRGPR